ncbi:RIX1 domain-containing protein [Pyrenophora tritici-repentis]|nr:RIX1 domain-containing protein [Pyrenophora tritici-repentis]KAI0614761.1 RIX1 domain-containing protein [Pyrenophora tritici-repentis]KAI0626667.1 RIX1 domain-containing protein [Pyrenophora tritici-repentis]
MAPIISELATLRALSFRISSTPTSQLPQHVPAIASALANCRTLLSSPQASGTKATSSEASVAIHKFRTLLSTLLQDRTPQGRWCAIVLIKATIEVGGWETLQKSLPWVRGLLGFLNKPDPPSSKKLCIITLTRIFFLTREYPTLVREITTPSLPSFIQSSLHMANATSTPTALLQTILECLNELLPRHPTIFRSYLKQLHPLLARLIAPTPSNKISPEQIPGTRYTTSSEIIMAARELYVQLSCCAPKGTSSEEWMKSLKALVNNAHQTADHVFRAVLEDWQPTTRESPLANGHTLEDEVQDLEPNNHLPPWSGIFAGGERLKGLLNLITEYLGTPTAGPIYLNIAMVMDLISRVLSLTIPASSSKSFQNTVRLNIQVSKDEREALWLLLPDVHIAAMKLLLALADRSQASTLALDPIVIDQVVWVFGAEKNVAQIRTTCYTVVASLLKRSGIALPKATIDSLVPLIRLCCDDLLPSEIATAPAQHNTTQTKTNGNSQPQTTANADSFLSASKAISDPTAGLSGLKEAAYDLLPTLLSNIRAQYLSDSMRARLDRTAVLIQHKEAIIKHADEHCVGQELDDLLETAGQTGTIVRDFAVTDALAAGPAANTPSRPLPQSSMAQRPMISEPTMFADVKRPMGDEGPLSPSKRAKTGEAEHGTTHPISPVLAHDASLNHRPITSGISATSDFTATSTASAAPELPVPCEGGLDDDSDDDKISLVLGQDTDDESD